MGPETGRLFDLPLSNGDLAVCVRRSKRSAERSAVVFLHGLIGHQKTWLAVAPRLPTDLDWVSLDLAGRGASQDVEPIWGIDRHVDDVAEVCDVLGYQEVLVVGYSFGAFVACRLAERFEALVSALVVVDGGVTLSAALAATPIEALESFLGDSWPLINNVYRTRNHYNDVWRCHSDFGILPRILLAEYSSYGLGGLPPGVRNRLNLEGVTADGFELFGDCAAVTSLARIPQPVELLRSEFAGRQRRVPLISDSAVATFVEVKSNLDCRVIPDTHHPVMPLLPQGADAIAAAIQRRQLVRS